MSLFSTAYAATSSTAPSNGMNFMSFLPMVIIFILFWFLLIRPQQKKSKLHNKMLTELQKGDEIMTSGGIIGKIAKIEDKFIGLEIASNVVITIQRNTVTGKVEKGTFDKKS